MIKHLKVCRNNAFRKKLCGAGKIITGTPIGSRSIKRLEAKLARIAPN